MALNFEKTLWLPSFLKWEIPHPFNWWEVWLAPQKWPFFVTCQDLKWRSKPVKRRTESAPSSLMNHLEIYCSLCEEWNHFPILDVLHVCMPKFSSFWTCKLHHIYTNYAWTQQAFLIIFLQCITEIQTNILHSCSQSGMLIFWGQASFKLLI